MADTAPPIISPAHSGTKRTSSSSLGPAALLSLLDHLPNAVLCLDNTWRITYANAKAMAISRLTAADFGNQTHWQLYPETVGEPIETLYRQVMTTRIAGHIEYHYQPFDIWVDIHVLPIDTDIDAGIVLHYTDITDERAIRQDLLDQQATLTFVKQTARVATWIIDMTTGAMTIGDGSYPVFGRPNEQINTLDAFRAIVHPDDREPLRHNTRIAIETRAVTSTDYRVLTPDGSILWLEGRGMALYDEQGNVTHLRGMTTDITTRKENEQSLAASEARYRVLADLNPQAIWIGSPAGRILYANQGFLDYTGQTIEDMDGIDWLSAFDPLDTERVLAEWAHSIATGNEYLIDARLRRKQDGASRWWTLRSLPVRNDAGVIQQWLGVAYDIHDLRSTAESLREKHEETERQRAELETVYRTAPVGLGLFDPIEFRYLRLNDRLAEIIGKPIDQILGHTISEIAPPAARTILEQVVSERTMQRRLIEGEFPGRPGELHHFNVNYSPVFAPDGSIQAIATATLDITHQKKAEMALIQSEKLAAVGRLASSISHEINNPLEAITNLLFLIALDDNLPEPVKVYVHMAQSELGRVSQIVTQTLRFHRQAVNPTEVTAAELVNAVLNLYQGRLSNSAIRIEAHYASNTRILCFENDIRQVLNNLIANAIDAMRSGGRLLVRAHHVSATNGPGGLAGVRIAIADTGHGMSSDVVRRIYEPFFTTKDLNGTGLGLWISAGIVELHKGSLKVRSSQHPIHHGTIFTLFLPTAPEPRQ